MHHMESMKCYTRPRIFSESLVRVFYMVVDFRPITTATQPEGVREQDAGENVRT
jgi:predicted transcriptional regulator